MAGPQLEAAAIYHPSLCRGTFKIKRVESKLNVSGSISVRTPLAIDSGTSSGETGFFFQTSAREGEKKKAKRQMSS